MGFSKLKPSAKRPRAAVNTALTKEQVLSKPDWIWQSMALHHKITPAELVDHWLEAGAEAASDPFVDRRDLDQKMHVVRRFQMHATAQGWSVFAEERDGNRRPAGTLTDARHGNKTQYAPIKPSERRDKLRRLTDLHFEMDNPGTNSCNLAVVFGPASSHLRALDIDCLDAELSEEVQRLALEILGDTPFIRVGRAPKAMLFYRVEGADIDIPTSSNAFMQYGIKDPENAIEFLGAGRNATLYGLHHKTGESFDWSHGRLHPAIAAPMQAPLITRAQLKKFYRAVNEVRELDRFNSITGSSPIGGESEITSFQKLSDVWWPKNFSGSFIVNDESRVIDGREKFLTSMCWAFLSSNVDHLRSEAGQKAVLEQFQSFSQIYIAPDGKLPFEKIASVCQQKFQPALAKWVQAIHTYDKSGQWPDAFRPFRILEDGSRPMARHVPGSERPEDGSMDWLPEQPSIAPGIAGPQKIRGITIPEKSKEDLASARVERALLDSDEEIIAHHAEIAAKVDTAIDRFLDSIGAQRGEAVPANLHILKAPTGAGKTSRFVSKVGIYAKANPRQTGDGPILVCLPTHENIAEALVKAEASGMTVPDPEMSEHDAVEMLAANGVKATVFQGKIRAGCQRSEEMLALTSKGIGASRLCGATVEEGGDETLARMKRRDGQEVEKEEILCPFRASGECGYWKQMREVEEADVVFLPHSYLTMPSLPKALKNPRAVVIDESIAYRVLGWSFIETKILEEGRRLPFITKKELKESEGADREDLEHAFMEGRDHVAKTVINAMLKSKCPAQAIIDAGEETLVEYSLKVVKRAHIDERSLSPLSDMKSIAELTSKPLGAKLIEEERLWKIIADRIESIKAGTAKGDDDKRLQLIWNGPKNPAIRLSWRAQMNWSGVPTLLLDASANPEITAKLFGVSVDDITVHNIEAKMAVRTVGIPDRPYANRSFCPPEDASDDELVAAEQTIRKTRALISKVAGVYSHARVVVGSTISTRTVLDREGWTKPRNVDSVHFGALRGLDFAKNHMAALSIGRSEQPIRILDAYAGALTYDDEDPQQPYDALGTGMTADGKPLFRQMEQRVLKMRTGHDVMKAVPEMPAGWARLLEHQWRDEEIRQFLGRLRPVYRKGELPVYICMTSMIPEGVIIDELFTIDDMIEDASVFEMMRLQDGVLIADEKLDHPAIDEKLRGKTAREVFAAALDREEYLQRLRSTLTEIKFTQRGKKQVAMIAGWHSDPEEALLSYMLKNGKDIEILEIVPPARGKVESTVREPDSVEQAILPVAILTDETAHEAKLRRELQVHQLHKAVREKGHSFMRYQIEEMYRYGADFDRLLNPPEPSEEEMEFLRLEILIEEGEFDDFLTPAEISALQVADVWEVLAA